MILDERDVPYEPMSLFQQWFDEADGAGNPLPNAMALATVSASGRPANRFVLLKEANERGFVFFSNYLSRKAQDMDAVPYAAGALFWPKSHRQVRFEGRVEKLAASESDEYFRTRDRLSQIGATVSPQSESINGRSELDQAVADLDASLGDAPVPRPAHWGGYRVVPDVIEFWSGRDNRLHDRIRYRLSDDRAWIIERIAP